MEPRPFTLRLFVPSGRPEEIRIIEKIGWSGIGLSVPRSNLKEFNEREEASHPGIYVLHGPNPTGAQDVIYIGEADPLGGGCFNIIKGRISGLRLMGTSKNCHFPGTGKLAGPYETFSRTDFLKMRRQAHWRASLNFSRCPYVFTVQNNHLNKAHFQYLEAQLLCRAGDARRCRLDNGDAGNRITLSEPDKASAETFLEELLLCCPVFGLRAFEKPKLPGQAVPGMASASSDLHLTDESMKQKDGNTRVLQKRSKQPSMHLSGEPDSSKILYLEGREAQGKGYESPKGFGVSSFGLMSGQGGWPMTVQRECSKASLGFSSSCRTWTQQSWTIDSQKTNPLVFLRRLCRREPSNGVSLSDSGMPPDGQGGRAIIV